MTLQDTLPLVITTPYTRIVVVYEGRRYPISGAIPVTVAKPRLERLRRANPHDVYELVDASQPSTIIKPRRHR